MGLFVFFILCIFDESNVSALVVAVVLKDCHLNYSCENQQTTRTEAAELVISWLSVSRKGKPCLVSSHASQTAYLRLLNLAFCNVVLKPRQPWSYLDYILRDPQKLFGQSESLKRIWCLCRVRIIIVSYHIKAQAPWTSVSCRIAWYQRWHCKTAAFTCRTTRWFYSSLPSRWRAQNSG